MSTPPIEIAMLHRVETVQSDGMQVARDNAISLDRLEQMLQERRGRRGVDPVELARGRAAGGGGLLLTFDDAYASILEAVPLLERFEVPAVVFVTVGFTDGTAPPYELQLAALLAGCDQVLLEGGRTYVLRDAADRDALYRKLQEPLKPASTTVRRDALARLARDNGWEVPSLRDLFLSWTQLRELARHPLITIGGHGCDHRPLQSLGAVELWRELDGCRRRLQEELGTTVDAFAFPYGAHGHRSCWLLRLAGYRIGFTTEPHMLTGGESFDPTRIPRIDWSGAAG